LRVRNLIRILESDGWILDRTRGDHRQYKHPEKNGLLTVSGHPDDDVMKGTLNCIMKQAGLKKRGDNYG
jgi:predicted RNA binding protein YcfA (HicA-like mRNA interferase family)